MCFAYELTVGALVGLTIGSFIVYLALRAHLAGQLVSQAQRMASQIIESEGPSSRRHSKRLASQTWGSGRRQELAKAVEAERADAVDAFRAVLKWKIAEQMAPLLPRFLEKCSPADAMFIGCSSTISSSGT